MIDNSAQLDEEGQYAEAVAIANIPTLLMVLTQLTGDLRWLEEPYRPVRQRGFGDNDSGGLTEELQAHVREAALAAIIAWRHGRPIAIPDPDSDLLVRMLEWSMGEPVPPEYGEMIASQVGLSDSATKPPIAVPESFEVLIIGAGIAGICAAFYLERAGIPFTIVEKGSDLGGTWRDNKYPGAGVDVPNHLYAFSFAPNDWSMYFALRNEIQDYLENVTEQLGLRQHIQFNTTAERLVYQSEGQRWAVTLHRPDGSTDVVRPNVVISAIGIFNPPKYPDIPGLERFAGQCVHTAAWPDDLDLTGKRVAVIGSGASAMQVAPEIQDSVSAMTVFQRSPHWAAPFEQFRREVPAPVRMLLREVPLYRGWYRARLAWMFNDRVYPTLQKDPEWEHPERSLNAHNEAQRKIFVEYIKSELGDRDDLFEQVLPTYPLFGKRMLLDNGWYRMLRNPKVTLVTTPIARVEQDRVITDDGAEYEADVLVLATGFDVQRFLTGFEAYGRSGQSLREAWNDTDPRAYMAGLTVPDFPNLFILYGPNSQPGHGGSVVVIMEMLMHYVSDALQTMLTKDIGVLECRTDVLERYVTLVDSAHERMVWTHPGMSTYYRNEQGRVVVIYPFRNVDLFQATRHFNLDDFVAEPWRAPEPDMAAGADSTPTLSHG